jgi:hypothetical protein
MTSQRSPVSLPLLPSVSSSAEPTRRFQRCKKWRRALEAAGIEFIDENAAGGIGVRLRIGVKLPPVRNTGKKR